MLNKFYFLAPAALLAGFLASSEAKALTLDWQGYFRADHKLIHNYQIDKSSPGYSNAGFGGEYIAGEGKKTTTFSSFYMNLKPKVLVNDNVIIRSEWSVGDRVAGFFGRGIPRYDRNNPTGTSKDGMDITVDRLWLDTHTDFGTLQVGRAPMQWGIGAIFHSGEGIWDRYQSTSDTIRLVSKFGYLSLMPLYAKNSMGRSLAGARNPLTDVVLQGSDDVTDYGLALKYENTEEDLEGGVIFYKRNASDAQTSYYYPSNTASYTGGANGMNLKLFDFYAKKKWTKWELGAELPIYNGTVGDVNGVGARNTYKATGLAVEGAWKGESWKHSFKLGSAPGQGPAQTGNRGKSFGAMSFHRNYKLGLILFNYNLGQFGPANPDAIPGSASPTAAANNTVSPYDASITNAKYLMLATEKRWEQWSMNFGFIYAMANETAQRGQDFYNHRTKSWGTANASQSNKLGMEIDFGTRYNWDDNISFGGDIGLFLPGDYFSFINHATKSGNTNTVGAFQLSVATSF